MGLKKVRLAMEDEAREEDISYPASPNPGVPSSAAYSVNSESSQAASLRRRSASDILPVELDSNPYYLKLKNASLNSEVKFLEDFYQGEMEVVGEGTFGKVFRVRLEDGTELALKKVHIKSDSFGFPLNIIRELKIMSRVSHPSILPLLDVIPDKSMTLDYSCGKKSFFYMVFPFMDHDLAGLIDRCRANTMPNVKRPSFSMAQIKYYLKEIVKGVRYLHKKNIIHRDLKCKLEIFKIPSLICLTDCFSGANILISNKGEVKLCDFGLARTMLSKEDTTRYTDHVVTRWYRAPELFCGDRHYTMAIDIWAIGCIFAEMLIGYPLFRGSDDLDMITKIYQLCGTPTVETWPEMSSLSKSELLSPQIVYKRCIQETFEK